MIKIKHLNIFQVISVALLTFSIVFAGSSFSFVSAAEPGCYQEARSGRITAEECEDGIDPSPRCVITSDEGVPRTVDCNSFDVTENSESTTGAINNANLNGEATLDSENYCGKGTEQVRISFDIGCLGNAYEGDELNPVLDMLFALLRFVSAGVGLIVIGSIIWAGIQYSTSRGNPQSTEASIKRVTNAVIALLLYIFSFAILNFLVPGGLFVG